VADPNSQLEIERKYDAERDFALPDLSGLPGVASVSEPRTHLLVANYFDTSDHRLAARGITLRRRRGGEDAGWHLKIPAGPDSKNELRAAGCPACSLRAPGAPSCGPSPRWRPAAR
jgi:CYTH domain